MVKTKKRTDAFVACRGSIYYLIEKKRTDAFVACWASIYYRYAFLRCVVGAGEVVTVPCDCCARLHQRETWRAIAGVAAADLKRGFFERFGAGEVVARPQ